MLSIVLALGWPIWLLILASIVVMALIIERALALQPRRTVPANLLRDVQQVLARGPATAEILARLAQDSPLGYVLAAGLRVRGAPRATVVQAMEVAVARAAHELARNLPLLGALGSIAPLLGLLGTVVGMIEIFAAQQGTSNPQELAQGISVALYSTAFGILVAVPAVLAHRMLRARVETLLVEIEQQAQQLLEAVASPE